MTQAHHLQEPAALPREGDHLLYRKLTWRLVPFFCICYLVSYLDRVNVGIAKIQMLDDLNFSETVYGLGAGLFFIGYTLLEVPSNILLHRIGPKVWLARIMITWGILSAATAFVQTPLQFYIVRALLGAAEAGFLPGILLYLTNWYPAARRSKVLGLFLLGLPLASLIGGPLSGAIMTAMSGLGGWHGWQWMFVIEALPAILLGVVLFFYLPNHIRTAKWLTTSEMDRLEANLAAEPKGQTHSALKALRDPKIWLLGFVCMSAGATVYIISFWLPTIIHSAGVASPWHIGLLIAIPNATAIVMMVLVSSHSDKKLERRWHLSTMLVITAIALYCSTLNHGNLVVTITLMSIANGCVFAAIPVFWCLPSQFLSGPAAAAGIALINSIASLGGFGATFLLGWIKDTTGTVDAGLIVFSIVLLMAVAIVLKLRPTAKPELAAAT